MVIDHVYYLGRQPAQWKCISQGILSNEVLARGNPPLSIPHQPTELEQCSAPTLSGESAMLLPSLQLSAAA
jgi:hypothetical protein